MTITNSDAALTVRNLNNINFIAVDGFAMGSQGLLLALNKALLIQDGVQTDEERYQEDCTPKQTPITFAK